MMHIDYACAWVTIKNVPDTLNVGTDNVFTIPSFNLNCLCLPRTRKTVLHNIVMTVSGIPIILV